jgi:CRISPR/Cas system-associated endoribonuclease Cas2
MKRYLTGTLLLLLALGLTMPAFARTSMHHSERNQMRRIQQGIHSGELTRKEARILRREQRNIRRLKQHFVRDGRISRHERRALRKRYAKAGRHIYRFKHNERRRYAYGYGPYAPRYNGGYGVYGFLFGQRF